MIGYFVYIVYDAISKNSSKFDSCTTINYGFFLLPFALLIIFAVGRQKKAKIYPLGDHSCRLVPIIIFALLMGACFLVFSQIGK